MPKGCTSPSSEAGAGSQGSCGLTRAYLIGGWNQVKIPGLAKCSPQAKSRPTMPVLANKVLWEHEPT